MKAQVCDKFEISSKKNEVDAFLMTRKSNPAFREFSRLHSAIGYRPPAPQTILPHRANQPSEFEALRADRRSTQAKHGLN